MVRGVLLLLLAVGVGAQNGHFRYANIYWEKDTSVSGETAVLFTIKSSWWRSYPGFQSAVGVITPIEVGSNLRLTGYGTPTLSVGDMMTAAPPAQSFNLNMSVTAMSEHPLASGGDWITGHTQIRQVLSSAGPYVASFTGCCKMGTTGEPFNVSTVIDLRNDETFVPAIVVLPHVYTPPDDFFSVPALRLGGRIDEARDLSGMPVYRWSMHANAAMPGISIHADTGVVTVPAGTPVGETHVTVSVWTVTYMEGASVGNVTMNYASVSFMLTVSASPAPTATVIPAGAPRYAVEGHTLDRLYDLRTGFKIELTVTFAAGSSTVEVYTNEMAPEQATITYTDSSMTFLWDKPCQGDQQEMIFCFTAMDVSTWAYSKQLCLHLRILEDEAPVFERPTQTEWVLQMGVLTTFDVYVKDYGPDDEVSHLGLIPETPLPSTASLTPAILDGTSASMTFVWTPLSADGGHDLQLCFSASDQPGSLYETCRPGLRTRVFCVRLQVTACKYTVRPKENLYDVARMFATDWVQLWALNTWIIEPDYGVGYKEGNPSVLDIGHLYKVDSGDYLHAIAYKFGTTLKMLLMLNADLADRLEDPLEVGRLLCIMPNSCNRD